MINRRGSIVALMIGLLAFAGVVNVSVAQTGIPDDVSAKIADAESAVAVARDAIAKGKELVAQIPEGSPYLPEVTKMLQAAASNWKGAVESLKGANESAQKIPAATSDSLAQDYALLAKVNADVAKSGAKVVQIALAYVEAVANNKTESLDLLRASMHDALAGSSQVQFYYDKIKAIIAEEYSN